MLAKKSTKKSTAQKMIEKIKKEKPVSVTEEQKTFLQDLKMEQDEGPR